MKEKKRRKNEGLNELIKEEMIEGTDNKEIE